VRTLSQSLFAKIAKHFLKISCEGISEISTESSTAIALTAETKPVLFNLRKQKPMRDRTLGQFVCLSTIANENKVPDNTIVQITKFGTVTVEE